MDEQLKFLDAEGIKYLWSKISMQDYPNNEMLVSVINAIDSTKADRSEVPAVDPTLTIEGAAADAKAVGDIINDLPSLNIQSDWDQNDENQADYVKNRPISIEKFIDIAMPAGEIDSYTLMYDFEGMPEFYEQFNADNIFVPIWEEFVDTTNTFTTEQTSALYIGFKFDTTYGYSSASGIYPSVVGKDSSFTKLDDKNFKISLVDKVIFYFIFDTSLLANDLKEKMSTEGIYAQVTSLSSYMIPTEILLH